MVTDHGAPGSDYAPTKGPTNAEEFLPLIHHDDRALAETSLAQAAAAGTDFKQEFRIVWPDGNAHWIDASARMTHGTEDESQHWIGIGIDIGDRKALEAQLRQAQKMEASASSPAASRTTSTTC